MACSGGRDKAKDAWEYARRPLWQHGGPASARFTRWTRDGESWHGERHTHKLHAARFTSDVNAHRRNSVDTRPPLVLSRNCSIACGLLQVGPPFCNCNGGEVSKAVCDRHHIISTVLGSRLWPLSQVCRAWLNLSGNERYRHNLMCVCSVLVLRMLMQKAHRQFLSQERGLQFTLWYVCLFSYARVTHQWPTL